MDEYTVIGKDRCRHGNNLFTCEECKELQMQGIKKMMAGAVKVERPKSTPDGPPYTVDYNTGEYICGTCKKRFPAAYPYKTSTPRVMSTRKGIAGSAAANFNRHINSCYRKHLAGKP